MELIRGIISLVVTIFFIICVILQVKRCRKTYYNMFNLHIITAVASVCSIGFGCGLLFELLSSPEYKSNDRFANVFFIYVCIGLIIFGLILLVFNVYNGYKGLDSIFFAIINFIIQALLGYLCLVTVGIGFIVIFMFYKNTIGDSHYKSRWK